MARNYKHTDYKIILIELFPCNSKDELLSREQFHIDLAGNGCTNMHKAYTGLTAQEYHVQYDMQRYEQNKETIAEYKKQKVMCDCGTLLTRSNTARHEKTFIHTEYLKMLEA